jgi:HAD superfamily hydrolase (TIGR01509 family)
LPLSTSVVDQLTCFFYVLYVTSPYCPRSSPFILSIQQNLVGSLVSWRVFVKKDEKDLSQYGVLWDLDGVLIESSHQHFESWERILPRYGLRMTEEIHEQTFGSNNREILTILLGEPPDEDLLHQVSREKESAFREIIHGAIQALPGARELLQQFHARNMGQAIASSAPPENILVVVEELQIGDYLQALVSGSELPAKPDPAVYLEAARQIEREPSACVVIEDAVVGVRGAVRGGMHAIGVTTTHPASALQDADIVVESLLDLAVDDVVHLLKA